MNYSEFTSSDIARFWAKVRISDPDSCWEWTGTRLPPPWPYGRYCIDKRKRMVAHKAAYLFTHRRLSPGLKICHTCDNPPCCNPAHLFEGTQLENIQDALAKNRMAYGSRIACSKLKEGDIPVIQNLRENGMTTRKIATIYGVTHSVIVDIGKTTWLHVKV